MRMITNTTTTDPIMTIATTTTKCNNNHNHKTKERRKKRRPSSSSSSSSLHHQQKQHLRQQRFILTYYNIVIICFLLLLSSTNFVVVVHAAEEEKVTWTPNEEETSKSLPMSMKQRQQLLQLQQAIEESPNPNATLQQVAQSNGMSPDDLVNMLNKNIQDLQQNPELLNELQQQQVMQQQGQQGQGRGRGGGRSLALSPTKIITNLISTISLIISQYAKTNPKRFIIVMTSIVLVMYMLIEIPRTGLVLSSNQSLLRFSRGPTIIYQPPNKYISKLISLDRIDKKSQLFSKLSIQTLKTKWDDLDDAILFNNNHNNNNNSKTSSKSKTTMSSKGKKLSSSSSTTTTPTTIGPIMVVEHNMKQLQQRQKQRQKRQSSSTDTQLTQAFTAQVILSADVLAKQFYGTYSSSSSSNKDDDNNEDGDDDEYDNEDGDDDELYVAPSKDDISDVIALFLEHGNTLLSTRQLTEFVDDGIGSKILKESNEDIILLSKLSYVSSSNTIDGFQPKHGILVVPKLGDYKRYGLIYFQITQQEQEYGSMSSITLTSIKGLGHFDGQIHISIEKSESKLRHNHRNNNNNNGVNGNNNDVILTIHLIIPKKGRKCKNKILAKQIIKTICYSLATSIQRRTEQTLTRKTQSSRFKSKANTKATKRRTSRYEKEREIEEMAVERRRRWQRSNPNSGRYRPSGDRQRSPNNC